MVNAEVKIKGVSKIVPQFLLNFSGYKHATISGGQDISKSKWGIRFQKFETLINLISFNIILPRFMHNFSRYEHLRRLEHVPF